MPRPARWPVKPGTSNSSTAHLEKSGRPFLKGMDSPGGRSTTSRSSGCGSRLDRFGVKFDSPGTPSQVPSRGSLVADRGPGPVGLLCWLAERTEVDGWPPPVGEASVPLRGTSGAPGRWGPPAPVSEGVFGVRDGAGSDGAGSDGRFPPGPGSAVLFGVPDRAGSDGRLLVGAGSGALFGARDGAESDSRLPAFIAMVKPVR